MDKIMKTYYNALELANMNLATLPNSKKGVISRAKKENWLSRPRTGKGGGLEYAFDGLPKKVQTEIKARQTAELMKASKSKAVAVVKREREFGELDDKDRERVDNRLLMCLLVEQYIEELGTQDKALDWVSKMSKQNALPIQNGLDYNEVCQNAKASRVGGVGVGKRQLHGWLLEHKKASTPTQRLHHLAPAKQGRPVMSVLSIGWILDFLAVYRNPNGLSVSVAYRIFAVQYAQKVGHENVPSLTQVRHALAKVPLAERERGRLTGSEYKKILPYVKRDWNADWFMNNDVWVGDGHSLKLKVKHPDGKTVIIPELTVIMDAPSRFIVGWSLSFSESGFAVLDALRMGWQEYGFNKIYFSDNGSGEFNEMLDNEVTGILPRMGVTHKTGIPGNPQGRGIIERFMKDVPKMIAQSFASYTGKSGDKSTQHLRQRAIMSHNRAVIKGKSDDEMTALQVQGGKLTPTWQELYDTVATAIIWYNNEHTHGSIGMTPAQKRAELSARHQNEPVYPSDWELVEMFKVGEIRTVERCVIRYLNGEYFCRELGDYHKTQVQIYADQHDLSYLVVRDLVGRYLGTAKLEGHKVDAFPKDIVEHARQKSDKARIKNKQMQIDQIKHEANKQNVIDAKEMLYELGERTTHGEWAEVSDDDNGFEFYANLDWDKRQKAM